MAARTGFDRRTAAIISTTVCAADHYANSDFGFFEPPARIGVVNQRCKWPGARAAGEAETRNDSQSSVFVDGAAGDSVSGHRSGRVSHCGTRALSLAVLANHVRIRFGDDGVRALACVRSL